MKNKTQYFIRDPDSGLFWTKSSYWGKAPKMYSKLSHATSSASLHKKHIMEHNIEIVEVELRELRVLKCQIDPNGDKEFTWLTEE